jgi:type I restriction enzyme, R subunit
LPEFGIFQPESQCERGSANESLNKKLFAGRVELIVELDKRGSHAAEGEQAALRTDTAGRLRAEVTAMNLENFIVRPKRRYIERYSQAEAWEKLGIEEQVELTHEVAGLPSELTDPDLEAKLFDLLILRLQLALLRSEPWFSGLLKSVEEIAGLLEEMDSIPMVREQMPLIQEIQTGEFWQDVTTPMLENVRKKPRALLKLIEKSSASSSTPISRTRWALSNKLSLPVLARRRFRGSERKLARSFVSTRTIPPFVSSAKTSR